MKQKQSITVWGMLGIIILTSCNTLQEPAQSAQKSGVKQTTPKPETLIDQRVGNIMSLDKVVEKPVDPAKTQEPLNQVKSP